MNTTAKVVHGPITWLGKTGPVLRIDGDMVLVVLGDRQVDGEILEYEVWFPKVALEIVEHDVWVTKVALEPAVLSDLPKV